MSKLAITLACSDNDRTRAIIDGRVAIEGCDTTCLVLEPAEMFARACRYFEFDVTELSFSSYMRMVETAFALHRGARLPLARLPPLLVLYPHRPRHQLAGRSRRTHRRRARISDDGGAVAARHAGEEYGVKPTESVAHRRAGAAGPRGAHAGVDPGLDLAPIPADATLSAMLAAGEIDALLSARTPSVFLKRAPHVDRLFPNYKEVEQAYYKKTGYFPIMHLVAVRSSLAEKYPWLPASVFKAMLASKAIGLEKLTDLAQLAVALPWMEAEAETKALMGNDYWRYGVKECRHEIDVMTRYAHAQGLTRRALTAEELFAPSTFAMAKI